MNIFLPLFIFLAVIFGIIKKENVFSLFCQGAKEGIYTVYNIFPSLLGLIVSVGMLKSSGFFDIFNFIFTPIFKFLDIPVEILPMALLRPMSGSGSFAILDNIYKTTGVNSMSSLIASVMSGATETTFYTLSVYYGATQVTKTRHNLGVSLSADICSFILSVITVKIFFAF